ncbi:MAG TPA: hypothetical protein VHZ54_15895 [Solirubrobacterales bacterium]|jgi:hypothetical protein|nr:hypothetical protein [Solirubrobacterales bacterium]
MGTRRRIATLALLLTAFGALAGLARAEVIQTGDVRVNFHAGFSPISLPRESPAPITVELAGKISTTDGSHPPALSRLRVELNSAGQIDTHGLPSCPTPMLQATSSTAALERCRPALVGKGSFQAQLPVSNGLLVNGRALVFNGTVGGRPGMLIHIYISNPVRLTLVIPIKISHEKGKFGTVLTTNVPKLAGGEGSITELSLRIGRLFRVDGHQHSYLNAACAAPPGYPGALFSFARGTFNFDNGRSMHTTLVRDCKVRK